MKKETITKEIPLYTCEGCGRANTDESVIKACELKHTQDTCECKDYSYWVQVEIDGYGGGIDSIKLVRNCRSCRVDEYKSISEYPSDELGLKLWEIL